MRHGFNVGPHGAVAMTEIDGFLIAEMAVGARGNVGDDRASIWPLTGFTEILLRSRVLLGLFKEVGA